jgi:hypothetical protein
VLNPTKALEGELLGAVGDHLVKGATRHECVNDLTLQGLGGPLEGVELIRPDFSDCSRRVTSD